jgi:hypothetical protein
MEARRARRVAHRSDKNLPLSMSSLRTDGRCLADFPGPSAEEENWFRFSANTLPVPNHSFIALHDGWSPTVTVPAYVPALVGVPFIAPVEAFHD